MRKFSRILIVSLAVIVVLLLAGYIAVRSFLTPERVRSITQQVITQTLQYPVDIGETNLSFGFKISISVRDISISNAEGFRSGTMLRIDRTALNIQLLPLLQRKVVIGSIDFNKLIANLERNANNELNIAAVIPKETKGQAWVISLSKIRFQDCELNYYDVLKKTEYRLHAVNQQISFNRHQISITGNQKVSIPENKMMPSGDIIISNTVEYDTLSKDLRIRKLDARIDPLRVSVSGTIAKSELLNLAGEFTIDDMAKLTNLMPPEYKFERMGGTIKSNFSVFGTVKDPRVEGACRMQGITLMPKGLNRPVENIDGSFSFTRTSITDIDLRGNLGKTKFNVKGGVTGIDTREPLLNISTQLEGELKDFESMTAELKGITLSGGISSSVALKGTMKNPKYSGDITIRGAQVDGIGLGRPMSDLNIKGKLQNDAVRINECRGRIGKSDFSFTGFVSNFKKPLVQLDCRSKLIDLDELMPKKNKGKSAAGEPVPLTMQGTVTIAKLTGMDMVFTNINTNFSYVNGIIDVKNCRAQTYDGQVTLDFYYNANSPEPYRISTRMTSIQVQRVMQRFVKFDRLKGTLSGAVNFSGSGLDEKSVLSNMTGAGNVRIVNGEFSNFGFLVKLLSWMGLQGQNTVKFNDFNNGFKINNGRATIDDWTLSSQTGDFLTRGSIGLNGTIDMQIMVTLSRHNSGTVKKYHGDWIFFEDKDGRMVIDVLATGKFDAPQFKLDRDRIKQRIGGKIKSEFKEKTKDFESKIKDILKGFK